MAREFDIVDFVIAFENGELDDESIIDGFQYMIDNGLVWKLQGCYGRMAARLIDAGHCKSRSKMFCEITQFLNS